MAIEFIHVLGSKVHGIKVTEANLAYRGSLTLDETIMEAAGWLEYEKVLVVNNVNGERLETYLIKGCKGTGVCCLNGAAAHKGSAGHELIVMNFIMMEKDSARGRKPLRVFISEDNCIDRIEAE